MVFIVVVSLRVRAERVLDVLALIRTEFARPLGQGPGRRRAHVFQRLGAPTELLGCIEWDGQVAYDAYRRTPTHRAILDGLVAPSHARYCTRLLSFERMLEPSAVAASTMIATGAATRGAIEPYILGELRDVMVAAAGLVAYDVYRTLKQPAGYIVVHRWRSLADLETYRQHNSARIEQQLRDIGATLGHFTGIVTAQVPS